MKPSTVAVLAAVGVVAAVLLARKAASAGGDVVNSVLDSINPTSDQNVFYQGANSVVKTITGEADKTLGVWLWEIFNRDAVNAENAALQNRPPVVGDRAAIGGGSRGFY